MILEPTEITKDGLTFRRLYSPNVYWAVAYDLNKDVIISVSGDPLITVPTVNEEGTIVWGWKEAGATTDAIYEGFGADTFEELWDEIKTRGVVLPQNAIDYLSSIGYN